MARVAVISPCRDVAPYLAAAIGSVRAQRFVDFEYAIVDDASTDATAAIAAACAARDPRVAVVRHADARGAGAARQTGLAATTAPLVALLDGDDAWSPDFLAATVPALEAEGPDCAGVFTWSSIVGDDGAPTGRRLTARPGRHDLRAMLEGICPPGNGSCVVLRRAAVVAAGGFASARQGGDAETWLAMVDRPGAFFLCIPRILVRYRRRAGALSTGGQADRIASLERRLHRHGDRVPGHRAHVAFARFAIELGEGDDPRVRTWVAQARRAPIFRRLASRDGIAVEVAALVGNALAARLLRARWGSLGVWPSRTTSSTPTSCSTIRARCTRSPTTTW